MLYDPKWEQRTDPLSLTSLIAWLETQPADEVYDYTCDEACLLARYFTASGFENVLVGAASLSYGPNWSTDIPLPRGWDYLTWERPRNYGAALQRARSGS